MVKFLPRADTFRQKTGLTLLRLILISMIFCLLTVLGLMKFMRMIEFARSAEAFDSIRRLRYAVQRCVLFHGGRYGMPECAVSKEDFKKLSVGDPSRDPQAHFSYKVVALTAPLGYRFVATRNGEDGGFEGDRIELLVSETGAIIKRCGTGNFESIGSCRDQAR